MNEKKKFTSPFFRRRRRGLLGSFFLHFLSDTRCLLTGRFRESKLYYMRLQEKTHVLCENVIEKNNGGRPREIAVKVRVLWLVGKHKKNLLLLLAANHNLKTRWKMIAAIVDVATPARHNAAWWRWNDAVYIGGRKKEKTNVDNWIERRSHNGPRTDCSITTNSILSEARARASRTLFNVLMGPGERDRYDPKDANDDEMMTINMYTGRRANNAKRMMDVIEVELFVDGSLKECGMKMSGREEGKVEFSSSHLISHPNKLVNYGIRFRYGDAKLLLL